MSGRSAAARLDEVTPESGAPQAPAPAPTSDLSAQRVRARRRYRVNVYVLRLLTAALVLGAWELSTRYAPTIIDPFFWGQPSGIWHQLVVWFTEDTALGPLWRQVLVTMEETVGGFIVGTVAGVVFGVLMGRNRMLSDVFSIYIKAANAIPRVVLGALFAISLGLDIRSKIATAAVLVFFVVFFNAFQGVREVERNLIANARILGADDRKLTTEVIIPSALSWIIASLHISFGLALVGAVVGELFGATEGVGELIYSAEHNFNANGVFAGMLLLATMALIAEAIITALEDRLIKWRPPAVGSEVQI
jgi:NitT/TauT family transport system permease protein